jgi:MoaA/NifB/PqqE/SkfB family radical SAM enzyme
VPESSLRDRFERGLAAPICLTWELTYACNLACTHCLSSSGRRDPQELTTSEAKGLIDEIVAMQIFYVNIGGGEPMVRRDFFELVEHAIARRVGVKFSTNGTRIDRVAAERLAGTRLPRHSGLRLTAPTLRRTTASEVGEATRLLGVRWTT